MEALSNAVYQLAVGQFGSSLSNKPKGWGSGLSDATFVRADAASDAPNAMSHPRPDGSSWHAQWLSR